MCSRAVSNKDNHIRAIGIFNYLPSTNPDLKTLNIAKNYNKEKIKK